MTDDTIHSAKYYIRFMNGTAVSAADLKYRYPLKTP